MCGSNDVLDLVAMLAALALFAWMWWVLFNAGE